MNLLYLWLQDSSFSNCSFAHLWGKNVWSHWCSFLLWQSTGNNTRGSNFPVFCHEITDNEIKPVYYLDVFFQIICTTFVVAFCIFLGGGSLVCLSRGSWAQNVQTEEVNSFDSPEDPLIENEPENQTLFETAPPPRDQGAFCQDLIWFWFCQMSEARCYNLNLLIKTWACI